MYRKVVFSRDPDVLRLEAVQDTAAYISLKQKHTSFVVGSHLDAFGIYKSGGPGGPGGLNETYVVISPHADGKPVLATGHLKVADTIQCRRLYLDENASVTWNNALTVEVPEISQIVFQSKEALTPWLSMNRQGVGIRTSAPHPKATLHVNGVIYCDNVVSLNPPDAAAAAAAAATGPMIPLDDSGKIPLTYLPEIYQTSLIQNDVGVGIGTRTPCQKLHLEGSGYIRDRLGVGVSAPMAVLDVVGKDGLLPVVSIRGNTADGDTSALFILENHQRPIAQFNPKNIQFHVPTSVPSLTVDAFEIKDQFYRRPMGEWVLPESLWVSKGITTPSITTTTHQPFHIHAPNVVTDRVTTREWTRPVPEASSRPILPSQFTKEECLRLFDSMKELRVGLYDGDIEPSHWDWDAESWKQAYEKGQQLAKWIQTPENEMRVSSVMAFLWAMVTMLDDRVRLLEKRPF